MVAFKPDFAVKYQQHRVTLGAANQGGGVNPNLAPQRLHVGDGVEPARIGIEPAHVTPTRARACVESACCDGVETARITPARVVGVVDKDGPLP